MKIAMKNGPCATDVSADHESLWELRQRDGAYELFCPVCDCRVGGHGGREPTARPADATTRRARPAASRCRSCGRELPRLSLPMAAQTHCAFCRNVLHKA